jgi:hypothetical protein
VFATPGAGTVVGKSKQTNHIGKLLVNFVCQSLDSWQCDSSLVDVKNKSIVNGAGLLRLDHGLGAMVRLLRLLHVLYDIAHQTFRLDLIFSVV